MITICRSSRKPHANIDADEDIVTFRDLLDHSDVKMPMRQAHTSRGAKAQAVRSLAAGGNKVLTKPGSGKKVVEFLSEGGASPGKSRS